MTTIEMYVSTHYGYCYFTANGLVYNLYVEPMYRKRGLGRRLLQMAIKELVFLRGGTLRNYELKLYRETIVSRYTS